MAKVIRDFTAKHAATKNDTPAEIRFAAGEEVDLLNDWSAGEIKTVLIRKDGKVFNVPRDLIEG